MEKHLNGNTPFTWSKQTSEPLPITDIPTPDAPLSGIPQLLAWGLNSYAPMMCILGLLAFLKTYFGKLQSLLEDHFTSTLHVKATDETYDMILAWTSARRLDASARSIIARVGAKHKSQDDLSMNGKKPICISPWNGGFWFRFRGTFLSYRIQSVSVGLHKEEVITVTCLGRSVQVLKDLVEECRVEYLKKGQNKLAVFKNYNDYWKKVITQKKRPLSTVITSKTQKQDLMDDVKEFLHPETQAWYVERGIPYRRGFLLYGPPGTGKTSLVSAVAGEFDLDIRAISIPSVDDKKLQELFDSLPERCIVLLEDIDAVETYRSRNSDTSQKKTGMLSLSGLLNTLDGVAAQEGRILFMTTNHINKLDSALKRPGRIDKEFEIKLADKDVIFDLFKFIFTPDACRGNRANVPEAGTKRDEEQVTQEKAQETRPIMMRPLSMLATWWQDRCSIQENVLNEKEKQSKVLVQGKEEIPSIWSNHVNELATVFAAKVPELKFSSAQIMSHLLLYKNSPEDAVKHAEGWVKKFRTKDLGPSTEDCEPSEDVLWMKGSKKKSPVAAKLNKIKKCSNLRLTVPVSPPPSPSHSTSQPCSASTHFSLSTLGEATDWVTSVPTCVHKQSWDTTKDVPPTSGFSNWKEGDLLKSDMEDSKSRSNDSLPWAKAEQQMVERSKMWQGGLDTMGEFKNTAGDSVTETQDAGSGNIKILVHSANASSNPEILGSRGIVQGFDSFPVEWGTRDIGGIDIDIFLEFINENSVNKPQDAPDRNHLSVGKRDLSFHIGNMDMDFLLDDGATKMSEDDQHRIRKCWEEGKSLSGTTLAYVSESGSRMLQTEMIGGSGARLQPERATKSITFITSIEQAVTPNAGAAESSKLQTEVKAIPSSNAGTNYAVSCLAPMTITPDDNGPTSTPSKTEAGITKLRPLPENVGSLRTMEAPEAHALFSFDRDGLSQDNTKPTPCGSGSCKFGQLFDHQIGHSLNDLFDQTKDHGGMDAGHGLPPFSECVSEHSTEETPAKNKTQPEDRGSTTSTTIKVSSLSTPPLSAVGAPVSKDCTSFSANTDSRAGYAFTAEKSRNGFKAEDFVKICDTDVYFDLNCGAHEITKEDFIALGLQNLWWAKPNDTTTGPPPMITEDLHRLGNPPKDSPLLIGAANDGNGSEDNLSETKTRIDIGASTLPANVHSLRNMKAPPSFTNFFGVCGPQESPGDALPGSSPERQAPNADDKPRTDDSTKLHDVNSPDSADESFWVKVKVGTDNLATCTDM